MVIESLALITTGAVAARFGVNWYRYAKSEWAAATQIPFLKHCYKKYIQPSRRKRKGYAGEYELGKELSKVPGYKKLLFDVLLPTKKGTTELDAVMVHETGVYVFENKNYGGTIGSLEWDRSGRKRLGNVRADAERWDIQYSPREVRDMYSPILQNEAHMRNLRKHLKGFPVSLQHCFSYVVFNNDAKVKGAPFSYKFSNDGRVTFLRNLVDDLNVKMHQCCKILTQQKVDALSELLTSFAHVTDKERGEHVARVTDIAKRAEEERLIAQAQPVCVPLQAQISEASLLINQMVQDVQDQDRGNIENGRSGEVEERE